MFAASCIGVIALVLVLEFLRRLQREYDWLIQRRAIKGVAARTSEQIDSKDNDSTLHTEDPPHSALPLLGGECWERSFPLMKRRSGHKNIPTTSQQAVRAGIYMLQFATAYILMLFAMYYNGYILVCIFIGAFVGFFIFSWDTLSAGDANM